MIKQVPDLLPTEKKLATEWLRYYGVLCPVKCLIGEWILSEEGDIVHSSEKCSHYPVLSPTLRQFSDTEIVRHVSSKTWFVEREPDIRITLLDALELARRIVQEQDDRK